MFNTLADRFNDTFRKLSGQGRISEANVHDAMEEVRTALLEADAHYEVVQQFTAKVQAEAISEQVLQSLKPGQLMIKLVYDALVELMGPVDTHLLEVDPPPTIVMLAGLQGSGKTTTCAKMAAYLRKKGRSVCLAAADLQRPAAVDQLETLAQQVNDTIEGSGAVTFYAERDKVAEYGQAVGAAVTVARNAVKFARNNHSDVLILDTAGRLHVNDELMGELRKINKAVNPHQIYLVIDAMTGQDAVNSAKAFNEQLELDGVILTKFDSDTRGGAALSVKHVTGKPIKFIGVGEQLDALDEFHPERIASRILGMGDIVSLVEKAQEQVSEEEALALQEKMAKGKMTMDDFLGQLKSIRRMGSMKGMLSMLPGIGNQLKDLDLDDKQLDQTEAIIKSMTPGERQDVDLLNNSRRRRISRGSGTSQQDVSQLVKGFGMVSQMGKQMSGMGMIGKMKALTGIGQMDLSALGGQGMPKVKGSTKTSNRGKFKQRKRRGRR
jgi:signal recognition particle subunit SRP54